MLNSQKRSLLRTYWNEIRNYNRSLRLNAEYIRRSEDHLGLETSKLLNERMRLLEARYALFQVVQEVKSVKILEHLE